MARWLLFTAILATTQCASSPSEPNAMSIDPAYANLRTRVSETGTIQVIVGIRVDGTPTEAAIARAQDDLMASLPADHVEEASRFTSIPFIVLRVDAAGLNALIASPGVTSIEEDVASPSNCV